MPEKNRSDGIMLEVKTKREEKKKKGTKKTVESD
jgi:hypothetical protein